MDISGSGDSSDDASYLGSDESYSDESQFGNTSKTSETSVVVEESSYRTDDPGVLNTTESSVYFVDETTSSLSSKTISTNNMLSASRETFLSETASLHDSTRTELVSFSTRRTMGKSFTQTLSRRSRTYATRTPIQPIGNGDMVTSYGDSRSPLDPTRNVTATLVLIPSVVLVFLLLLFVIFVLLWKKLFKKLRSEKDSVRSHDSDKNKELGDVDQTLANPGKKECGDSLNQTTNSHNEEKGTSEGQNTIGEVKYAEVDDNGPTITDDNIPENEGKSVYEQVDIEGHVQASNCLRETQSYGRSNGDDESRKQNNGRNGGNKITGPVYYSLDPNQPFYSSYMSVPTLKQDGSYDHFDRQKNLLGTKSKSDSSYDWPKRIGKDDSKLKSSDPTELSGYSVLCSSLANSTSYDKLDHTRGCDVDNVKFKQVPFH